MSRIAVILTNPWEYNTSSMLRCRTIICALADSGHKVICFTPFPEYDNLYYVHSSIEHDNIELIRFGKQKSPSNQDNRNNNRVLRKRISSIVRFFVRKVDVFGSSLLLLPYRSSISSRISKEKVDCIISFSDPMTAHMIGKYCKKKNPCVKYIQQWGDPLAADTIAKTAQPVWVRKLIEKSMIKLANRVYYVSPFTLEEQKKLYPKQSEKMRFLPTPSLPYCEIDNTSNHEGIVMGYFGSYNSKARNILPLYEAARKVNDLTLYIIGDSDVKLESAENIRIIPRVSKEDLDSYIQQVDVIICLMNKKGNQIPGKVYHDASSTKDILLIKDGEYGDSIQLFFEKYNHYTFVENNVTAISTAFEDYLRNGVPQREPVSAFQAEVIANRMLE